MPDDTPVIPDDVGPVIPVADDPMTPGADVPINQMLAPQRSRVMLLRGVDVMLVLP